MATIGTRIREVRKEKELSQSEFGRRIGYSTSTVSAMENNRLPKNSGRLLHVISIEFCVRISWLKTGRGEKYTGITSSMPLDRTVSDHRQLVEKFKDKEMAKGINEKLLKIEKIQPSALREIDKLVDGVLKGLELKSDK